MAKKNIMDDGRYQEKQKLKPKKDFFKYTEEELDEALTKQQEKAERDALFHAKYGIRLPEKKPASSIKSKSKKPKPVVTKKDNTEYPTRARQTLESILDKPLGEE
jgi:hypothetical protein